MTKQPRIHFFAHCLVDSMYPEVGDAVVTLLDRLGVPVTIPSDQTCCGQVAFNSGYRKEAKKIAKHFVRVFENADLIVCPSGSCVKMVRLHYPELFQDDPEWLERTSKISSKIYEFTEFLVDVLGIEKIQSSYQGRVTFHDSCSSYRGLGIKKQPRTLIENIKGATFVEMHDPSQCCGFGGLFFLKYPGISKALAKEKATHILNADVDTVVSCDMGCLMNIESILNKEKTSVRCLHISQLFTR